MEYLIAFAVEQYPGEIDRARLKDVLAFRLYGRASYWKSESERVLREGKVNTYTSGQGPIATDTRSGKGNTKAVDLQSNKPGPDPDMERHCVLAASVDKHGHEWRKKLDNVAASIDSLTPKMPLPKTWKQWKPTPARNWTHAATIKPERFIKLLEYSLKMAKQDNSRNSL
ncbi:MAG: hypothetical protein HYX73_10840 [Acidobacteria bacterium]|nr:hypothetical protein [Acidobacteriota bacterium]